MIMKNYKHKYTDRETEPDYPVTFRCFNCWTKQTVSGQEAEYHNITNENFLCQDCSHLDIAEPFKITDMKTKVKLETEKEVSVSDLTFNDNIGFVDDYGNKGHVVCIDGIKKQFIPVTNKPCSSYGDSNDNIKHSVIGALNLEDVCACIVKEVFVFDTRRELYQWLAE